MTAEPFRLDVVPIALVDDAEPALDRRRRGSRAADADLRELRRHDGRAQVQAHLPLRLLPVLFRLLLSGGSGRGLDSARLALR